MARYAAQKQQNQAISGERGSICTYVCSYVRMHVFMHGYMSVFICVCLCIYAGLEINFIILKEKTRKTQKTLSYAFVYFFYHSIQKFVFGGLIGHIATRFLFFLWISWFAKFLGLNSFGTSLNNSYTEFVILNVKFHFICGKLNSCRNTVYC